MTKILKNLLLLISIVVTVLYFSSCEQYQYLVENDTPPPTDTAGKDTVIVISFKKSVEPIFTIDNCIACHKSGKNPDLRTGFAYKSLKNGGFVEQPASTSKLYVKITKDAGHSSMMPLKASKDTIYMWIDQGAKDN